MEATLHAQTVPAAPLQPRASALTWLIRLAVSGALIGVIFAALAAAGVALYDLQYQGRVFPGVHVGGVDLSGLTAEEAARALTGSFGYADQRVIVLVDGNARTELTPAELGISYDLLATVERAYAVGRSQGLLGNALAQFDAWHAGVQLAPVIRLNEGQAYVRLNDIAAAAYRPVIEASLSAEGGTITATPGQIGRQLEVQRAFDQLHGHLLNLEPATIELPYTETAPLILDASAQADQARAILAQPLTLTIAEPVEGDPGEPWTISTEQLGTMLRVERVAEGNAARYEVRLDEAALRGVLEPLAPSLQRFARNARFIFNDDTRLLEVIEPSQNGRILDVAGTLTAINESIGKGQSAVPLVFQIQTPAVADTATGADLGITELVSAQYTSFRGSSPERMQNIATAAARFHGLMVPPGATFSFADNIGDISLDSGFAEALIIYGGRTIRGVGGGVCQVSTTLFRTVYFGGFPIVERNAHAYRVGYYEQNTGSWSGPGLDAAVFTPLVDLKFTNDTPYWLLMETYFYPGAQRLEWKFYSTSDGRTTTVNAATITNVIPAPPPVYEESAELAAGEIKQVDWQADGADTVVSRVVMRDGVRINADEQPIRTRYQPWRAIYQYGPGTPNMPPPEAATP
jgi:vancomycin resistance protein YoaR